MPEITKPRFTCPRCGFESWNDNDRIHNYCARCKVFIDDYELERVLAAKIKDPPRGGESA